MDSKNSIKLLLIGKTGNGKSALGNAILGKDCFPENSGTSSKEQEIELCHGFKNGRRFEIVECPGIGDTKRDGIERTKQLFEWLNKAMDMNAEGYDAFLLVLKYSQRFTDEETNTLAFLKQTFGEDFVRNHCVAVMTCGDNFNKNRKTCGKTFDVWCKEQKGIFQEVIKDCHGRILLFNNFAEGKESQSQIDKLLEAIKGFGGKRYTRALFEKAAKQRELALVVADKAKVAAEISTKINSITEKRNEELKEVCKGKITSITGHQQQCAQCDNLIQYIKRCDRSTGVMNDLEEQVLKVKRFLEDTYQTVEQRKDVQNTGKGKALTDFEESGNLIEEREESPEEMQVSCSDKPDTVMLDEESTSDEREFQQSVRISSNLTKIKQCFEEGINSILAVLLEESDKRAEMEQKTLELERKVLELERKQEEMQQNLRSPPALPQGQQKIEQGSIKTSALKTVGPRGAAGIKANSLATSSRR